MSGRYISFITKHFEKKFKPDELIHERSHCKYPVPSWSVVINCASKVVTSVH